MKFTPFLITLDFFGFYFTRGFFAKVSNVGSLTGLPVNDFFTIVFILNSDLINFLFLVIFFCDFFFSSKKYILQSHFCNNLLTWENDPKLFEISGKPPAGFMRFG